jgi:hypothetical protein
MEKTSAGEGAKFASKDVWKGETALGGSAVSITVGQNADGRLEIFYVGTNGGLYHSWQTTAGSSTWQGETAFAGDSATQIAAARNADGTLEIFYVGSNNDLYHNRQTAMNSSASGWRDGVSSSVGVHDPGTAGHGWAISGWAAGGCLYRIGHGRLPKCSGCAEQRCVGTRAAGV